MQMGLNIWQFMLMIIGGVSPTIVAYLQNPSLKKWQKITIAVIFHIFVALSFTGLNGMLTLSNVSGSFFQLFVYSTLSYLGYWKPKELNQNMDLAKIRGIRGIKFALTRDLKSLKGRVYEKLSN